MNSADNVAAGTAFQNIGWKFYFVFIIVPSCTLPLIVRFFPETKGLTLEEVGQMFGDEVHHATKVDLAAAEEKPAPAKHVESPA